MPVEGPPLILERFTRSGTCQPEQCGSACCTFVAIFQQRLHPVERAFFETRGIPLVEYPGGLEALHIQHRCQHLTPEGACALYGLPERPEACVAYPSHPFDLVGVQGCSYTFTKG